MYSSSTYCKLDINGHVYGDPFGGGAKEENPCLISFP